MKIVIISVFIALSIIISVISISSCQSVATNTSRQENPFIEVAKFDKEDNLIRPEGYREWVFAGSSLGLNYRENLSESDHSMEDFYHVTYIHPEAYKEFSKTGKFPEGTIMILEILSQEKKKEPGLQGSYGKDYVAVEASVKDSKRFKDGWAYFGFNDDDGKLLDKAKAFSSQSCFACHDKKAETDHVFTQFYAALSAAKPNESTK
ncbi:MAG: cytochrome P460 family protein [Blastocatellia bacterium]